MATNLTTKGQVTIPKKVRDYLGLKAGASVTFQRLDNGEFAIRAVKGAVKPRASRFYRVRHGILPKSSVVPTYEVFGTPNRWLLYSAFGVPRTQTTGSLIFYSILALLNREVTAVRNAAALALKQP